MRNNLLLRYAVLVTSVVLIAVVILLIPEPPAANRSGYSYLSRIAGTAAEHSLAADELAPDVRTMTVPEITLSTFALRTEAEDCERPDGVRIRMKRKGYSGTGYLSDMTPEHAAVCTTVAIPTTQHYKITVCAACDTASVCSLSVDGQRLTPINLLDNSDFVRIHVHSVFLTEGEHEIAVQTTQGTVDLDYIELSDDANYQRINFEIDEQPCDPNVSPAAEKLYHFLREQWGQQILTGQYASDSSNRELNLIFRMTGQLPAIRFSVLGTEDDRTQIDAAIDWNVYMHGIVGLMWQWNAPGSDSVYAKDSDFNLQTALSKTDPKKLANLSPEAAKHSAESGALHADALKLLNDIDEISRDLLRLRNMDIPVLWRPLHEAGGGWYWWGAYGRTAYLKLWSLIYYRMTEYHHLNNLIWIWNGQSSGYIAPADTYDIASVDAYLPPDIQFGSRYEQFSTLAGYTSGNKMLAISECSSIPDLTRMEVDQAYWSFFGVWYGNYLMNPDGTFSDTYYSSIDLYNLYNSDHALSLNDFLSLYQ